MISLEYIEQVSQFILSCLLSTPSWCRSPNHRSYWMSAPVWPWSKMNTFGFSSANSRRRTRPMVWTRFSGSISSIISYPMWSCLCNAICHWRSTANSIEHNYLLSISAHNERSPRRSGRQPPRRDILHRVILCDRIFCKSVRKGVRLFSPWVVILFWPWHVRKKSISSCHRAISIISSSCCYIEPSAIFSITWLIHIVKNNRSSVSPLLNWLLRHWRAICPRFSPSNGVEESSDIMRINRWRHVRPLLVPRSSWRESWSSTGKPRWRNVSMRRPWSFCWIHRDITWSSDLMQVSSTPIKSTVDNWSGHSERRTESKAVLPCLAMEDMFWSVKIWYFSEEKYVWFRRLQWFALHRRCLRWNTLSSY